jgi:phosphoribosylglycinamide formyltransferase-1
MPARLVVLASGSGSTLQAIVDALGRYIVAAGSDRLDCPAMTRAADAGIETFAVPFAHYADREVWNRDFESALAGYEPDIVVLAGFMKILGAEVVDRFRIINTHPALLPAFPGAHAPRDALAHGVKVSGVTVHWVDAGVDSGPIIAQAAVPVFPGDDEASLLTRIQTAEKPLYIDTLSQLIKEFDQ